MSIELFHIPVRVYIEDTDAGGIVYYVNYLKYMERARTDMFRAMGYSKPALFAADKMFVVHSLSVDYLASANLDDALTITASIKKAGRTYVLFEQRVERGDELLCTGEVKVACVLKSSGKPAVMPSEMIDKVVAAQHH